MLSLYGCAMTQCRLYVQLLILSRVVGEAEDAVGVDLFNSPQCLSRQVDVAVPVAVSVARDYQHRLDGAHLLLEGEATSNLGAVANLYTVAGDAATRPLVDGAEVLAMQTPAMATESTEIDCWSRSHLFVRRSLLVSYSRRKVRRKSLKLR